MRAKVRIRRDRSSRAAKPSPAAAVRPQEDVCGGLEWLYNGCLGSAVSAPETRKRPPGDRERHDEQIDWLATGDNRLGVCRGLGTDGAAADDSGQRASR